MTNDDFNDDIPDLDRQHASSGEAACAACAARAGRSPGELQAAGKAFRGGLPQVSRHRAFRSWGGRDLGACFNCKGAGKLVFKTSSESRAKSRASSAVRAQDKAKQLLADMLSLAGGSRRRMAVDDHQQRTRK